MVATMREVDEDLLEGIDEYDGREVRLSESYVSNYSIKSE
jgi:hypothetical protein